MTNHKNPAPPRHMLPDRGVQRRINLKNHGEKRDPLADTEASAKGEHFQHRMERYDRKPWKGGYRYYQLHATKGWKKIKREDLPYGHKWRP